MIKTSDMAESNARKLVRLGATNIQTNLKNLSKTSERGEDRMSGGYVSSKAGGSSLAGASSSQEQIIPAQPHQVHQPPG